MERYSIKIYLDKRRAKANGKYPVRLRVYTSAPKLQKLFPLPFEFTEKEFDSIWNTAKTRREYRNHKIELSDYENRAHKVAKELSPFSIEEFERKMFRKVGDGIRVKYHYDRTIDELTRRKQVSTASNYRLSQKSLKGYVEDILGRNYEQLSLLDINANWLRDFEDYMIDDKGRSAATVSIYIRALRTIFNRAIDENEIEREQYPFGKRKYQPPSVKNVKKALSGAQLAELFKATPSTTEQVKSRDFWFFSYNCNGMNIKDVANLKKKDVDGDKLTFYRAKTKRTAKERKPILVYLNEFTRHVIDTYGSLEGNPDEFVFPIISPDQDAEEQHSAINNFNRFIGQHMKKLCKAIDLPEVSAYWARHSFATQAIRRGKPMAFIQESLGHDNVKTTQGYFAGFEDEVKKEFADSLMDFE